MMNDFRLVQIARSIMKIAAKETGRNINKNQNLLAGLVNHLAPSISRLKMNMEDALDNTAYMMGAMHKALSE